MKNLNFKPNPARPSSPRSRSLPKEAHLSHFSSLKRYQERRDFEKSPEPFGEIRKSRSSLVYVIQRHEASHLHFDLRLELGGVLKSWAVPKEPTMNSQIKRLAVQVEDHPIDYAQFHGDIPEGEYGGGHVEIWDQGTWRPLHPDPLAAFERGHLNFEIKGKKLKGVWTLLRLKNFKGIKPGKAIHWLLIKNRDEWTVSGFKTVSGLKKEAGEGDNSFQASHPPNRARSPRKKTLLIKSPQRISTFTKLPRRSRETIPLGVFYF